VIITDFDDPGALADRKTAKRHGVAGVQLTLRKAAALLGIRHCHRKRSRAQDDPMTSEAI
jgi:hypothetical protein